MMRGGTELLWIWPNVPTRKVVDRGVELRVIPDVVEFRPELHSQRFRHLGVFLYRHVPVVLAGSHN